MTSDEIQKLDSFINHLLSLPNIKNDTPIGAESQIINFIKTNLKKLEITFKSPDYFPYSDIKEIIAQMFSVLGKKTVDCIVPDIMQIVSNEFDFRELTAVLAPNTTLKGEKLEETVKGFIPALLQDTLVRYNFKSVYVLLKYKKLEEYMHQIFLRKGFIYNELVRVQKNNLSEEQYILYLKFLLLLKNHVYYKKDNQIIFSAMNTAQEKLMFLNKGKQILKHHFTGLSDEVLKMALYSNLPETLCDITQASARLLYILSARFNEYDPCIKVDRGAESPDKSWFSIARTNSRFFGYNKGILDELYLIAGDNNW